MHILQRIRSCKNQLLEVNGKADVSETEICSNRLCCVHEILRLLHTRVLSLRKLGKTLKGLISLDSDEVDPKAKRSCVTLVVHSQCFLEGSLPFSEVSATGENVLIQGIGMDIISVPLHKMNFKSDLISGTVIVGVRPELPVKGVFMLLGNDLAGGKVLPEPMLPIIPAQKLIMMTKVVLSFQLVQYQKYG